MNLNTNLIGRLITNELPGLVGAMLPRNGGAQNLSELGRQQRRQNLANAMFAAASGMLMPSPNPYPLGPLQRLGAGLGAALESYNDGAGQEGILNALATGGQPRSEEFSRGRMMDAAPQARTGEFAVRRPASAPRRVAGRGREVVRTAAPGNGMLRKFEGVLGERLDHPAVLPGGWQLYGYEKQSGRPVYAGPGRELRIYT